MTGADTPTIGSVTPDTVLTEYECALVMGVGCDGYGRNFQCVVCDYAAGLRWVERSGENQSDVECRPATAMKRCIPHFTVPGTMS